MDSNGHAPLTRVLVVDDEEKFRSLVCRFLTQRGYNTQMACSAEEALTVLEGFGPDIVLLDVRMPGLSGLELLKRIRVGTQSPRVVMVTALDTPDVMEEAMRHGADGYLCKPLDLGQLGQLLSTL